eukprot:6461511-Amphidinium_carterae.1
MSVDTEGFPCGLHYARSGLGHDKQTLSLRLESPQSLRITVFARQGSSHAHAAMSKPLDPSHYLCACAACSH